MGCGASAVALLFSLVILISGWELQREEREVEGRKSPRRGKKTSKKEKH